MSTGTEVQLRGSSGSVMAWTRAGNTGVLDKWFNTRTVVGSGSFRTCTAYRGTTGTCTRLGR
ncbi:hypothetical protein ACWDA3_00190 [Nonomuraea rubra]